MCGCKRLARIAFEALQVGVDQRVDGGLDDLLLLLLRMLKLQRGLCERRRGWSTDKQLLTVGAQQGAGGVTVRH